MQSTSETFPVGVKDWNRKFAENPNEWFFGRDPSEMARLTLNYWRILKGEQKARVLDHGCGEGRDAVFFAEKGFEVTAVDGADSALAKLHRLASDKYVSVAAIHKDVRGYQADTRFDIVMSHNCLQFLGSDCLSELEKVQDMTAPGGLASVSAFTREAEVLSGSLDLYRFDRNELKFRFEGWRIMVYGEYVLWREPANCYLSFAQVIAQRPE